MHPHKTCFTINTFYNYIHPAFWQRQFTGIFCPLIKWSGALWLQTVCLSASFSQSNNFNLANFFFFTQAKYRFHFLFMCPFWTISDDVTVIELSTTTLILWPKMNQTSSDPRWTKLAGSRYLVSSYESYTKSETPRKGFLQSIMSISFSTTSTGN